MQHNIILGSQEKSETPYINQAGEIELPNNNSFFVFGSKSILTEQIEAVLNAIVQENSRITASHILIERVA